jgi:hypothetical protein
MENKKVTPPKIQKVKVPQFGNEEWRTGMMCVTMESKEAEIIKLAEKINEIIDFLYTQA